MGEERFALLNINREILLMMIDNVNDIMTTFSNKKQR